MNAMENICTWKELGRKGHDWFEVSCINSPVDPLKVASKRGITIVELFKKCPFCGKAIVTLLKDGKRFAPVSNEES